VLVLANNDSTEHEVYGLLFAARQAWDRELIRLNL
jgi:hypothetical protein